MICVSCRRENPEDARFCNGCGSPAQAAAGPERAPRDYTPKHLADRILQSKSALEGERKQLTVLFADVRGSSELAERLDPEDWHRILDRFFQILAEGVHRFEGTINQYTGDGIMALFGAPVAHEDHAQRACYAALRLRDELRSYTQELRRERGLDLATRIGLNSGEVVVGKIGDDLRMDYTAQGHVVHLAQRMEQLAEAGSAYLTAETAERVHGFFELDDLGEFKLAGSRAPVRVHALLGVGRLRTRFDLSRARGLSRFVGRHEEMERLDAALDATESGQGSTLALLADAGIGKSRLCFEFAERCRARGVRVYEGHCLPHGQAMPLAPILELLRDVFGVAEHDEPEEVRRKIAGTLLLVDTELASELPLVFELLGVPDPARPAPVVEAEARGRRLRDTLGRLTHARSEREPAVFLMEDLHWIDPASEEMLIHLSETARRSRSLLIVNARPEYQAGWLEDESVERIALESLGEAHLEALLREVLGSDPSTEPLVPLLRERSGGNPFFLEELVQSLAESGELEGVSGSYRLTRPVERLEVPSTVHAVLAARIDRLLEAEKTLLQAAAVVGRRFRADLIEQVVGTPAEKIAAGLASLESREFVRAEQLYPAPVYAFRHALTRDVALSSLLGDARKSLHGSVARALVETAPDQHGENAGAIASHFDEAGEAAAALDWYPRAARRIGSTDLSYTLHTWERVRELAEASGETDLWAEAFRNVVFDRARAGMTQAELTEYMAKARAVAERSKNPRLFADLLQSLLPPLLLQGKLRETLLLAREALEAAQRAGDAELIALARFRHGLALGVLGRTRDALVEMEAAGQSDRGADPFSSFQGLCLLLAGCFDEASALLERGLVMMRDANQPANEATMESLLAMREQLRGDPASMLRHARRSFELERDIGSIAGSVMSLHILAAAELANGNAAGARQLGEQALTALRDANTFRIVEPILLGTLARAHGALGDSEHAFELAREAIALDESRDRASPEPLLVLAELLLTLEEPSPELEQTLQRTRDIIEEVGQRAYLPQLYECEAALARLRGDAAAHERCLRAAIEAARELGAGPRAERLEAELAREFAS